MRVIVVGGGQVGSYIAKLLLENKCEVRIIEENESAFEKLKKIFPHDILAFGSGSDPSVLEEAEIQKADAVAAVTGADETNLMAASIAKFEYNVPRVIGRVKNPKNEWLFTKKMGIDVSLNQADLLAHLVIEEMNFKNMMMLLRLNRGIYSIVQLQVDNGSKVDGAQVKSLVIPDEALLIATMENCQTKIIRGDTVLKAGDNVLVMADSEAIKVINKLFVSGK